MRKIFFLISLLTIYLWAGVASAQTEPKGESLCSLQENITEGNHEAVRVSGIFNEGLDRGTLEDAACPKETTWVELALQSEQNKGKLRRLLEHSRRAYVVFEGEFYGPPLPDPNLLQR